MKAVLYHQFRGPIEVQDVPEPELPADGVVVEVRATGICRSDWHGWQGHDDDISRLPHVPGHEFAGVIAAVGRDVRDWEEGERVTMPFVAGCGKCAQCRSGNQQVCDDQFQPGFTARGSFAQQVAVRHAEGNLVRLPPEIDFATAASLGCRLSTAYRAVAVQGELQSGQWVAVHGCGGIGLSAILVAKALGGRVVAVDTRPEPLELARSWGIEAAMRVDEVANIPAAIQDLIGGGADLSLDALGSRVTCANSILSLRKRGIHVQVGLLAGSEATPPVPMQSVVARELQLRGSHGLQAHLFPQLLSLITSGLLNPRALVGRLITLEEAPDALAAMGSFSSLGVTVVDRL